MAFMAEKDDGYWEADVTKPIYFDSEWAMSYWNTPTVDMDADRMHETVVAEIAEKMKLNKLPLDK